MVEGSQREVPIEARRTSRATGEEEERDQGAEDLKTRQSGEEEQGDRVLCERRSVKERRRKSVVVAQVEIPRTRDRCGDPDPSILASDFTTLISNSTASGW